MSLFEDSSMRAIQGGLDAMWLKQQIASQNIANVETPGYKAKKVEFSQLLKDAGGDGSSLSASVTEDNTTQSRPDGNNVQVEREELELWKAYTQYSALTARASGKMRTLRYVINNTGK